MPLPNRVLNLDQFWLELYEGIFPQVPRSLVVHGVISDDGAEYDPCQLVTLTCDLIKTCRDRRNYL
jgi:hypothetical protein